EAPAAVTSGSSLRQVGAEIATRDRGLEGRRVALGTRVAAQALDLEAAPRCRAANASGPAVLRSPLVAARPAHATNCGIGEELAAPHVERGPDRLTVEERHAASEGLASGAAVENRVWTDIVGPVAAAPA